MTKDRGDSVVGTSLKRAVSGLRHLGLIRTKAGTCWRPLLVALIAATGALVLTMAVNGARGQAKDTAPKSSEIPSGNVETGKQLFRKNGCYECHGSQGQIASRAGPALTATLVPFDGFASYVRRPSGSMPAYTEKVLSNQELADIYAFLRSVPHPSK